MFAGIFVNGRRISDGCNSGRIIHRVHRDGKDGFNRIHAAVGRAPVIHDLYGDDSRPRSVGHRGVRQGSRGLGAGVGHRWVRDQARITGCGRHREGLALVGGAGTDTGQIDGLLPGILVNGRRIDDGRNGGRVVHRSYVHRHRALRGIQRTVIDLKPKVPVTVTVPICGGYIDDLQIRMGYGSRHGTNGGAPGGSI